MDNQTLAEKIHNQIDCEIGGLESKGWVAEHGDKKSNPTFFSFDIPDKVGKLEEFDFIIEGLYEKRIHYKKINLTELGTELFVALDDGGKLTGSLADEWEVEVSEGADNLSDVIFEGEDTLDEIQIVETKAVDTIYTFKRKT